MLHFFKKKDTNIRKAVAVSESGKKVVFAVIGQVKELMEIGLLIEPVNKKEHKPEAWAVVDVKNGSEIQALTMWDTMDEAKQEARDLYKRYNLQALK